MCCLVRIRQSLTLPQQKNTLRIIGGTHRGRRLPFPHVKGLRPTADRVRETLFNWLQGEIAGVRVLDLFAGSGALGLEALSRGAHEAVFIEKNQLAANQLRDNLHLMSAQQQASVCQMDALQWMPTAEQPFDVVFLDPPFAQDLLPEAVYGLEQSNCLKPNSWVYCEQEASHAWLELPANWHWHRQGRAGQAKFALLKYNRI